MEPIGYVYTEREIDMSVEAGKSGIYLQGKLTGWRPEEELAFMSKVSLLA